MGASFKENLREMLDYKDMTVKELAFKTAIPKRTIENYLNVRASIPPADYACKIAAALGTTVEYLVNGSAAEPCPAADVPAFSKDALELVQAYQQLLKKDKSVVLRITQALAHQ